MSNPLQRCHAVFVRAAAVEGSFPGWDAWSRILEINEVTDALRPARVAASLALLREEMDRGREMVRLHTRLSPQNVDGYFTSLNNSLHIPRQNESWTNIRGYLTTPALHMLGVCAESIPDDELPIGAENEADLRGQLEELEKAITADTSLPKTLLLFLTEQVARMRRAILEYQITGAVGLWRGAASVSAELAFREADLKPFKKSELMRKLSRLIRLAGTTAKAAVLTAAALGGSAEIGETLATTLDYWVEMFQGDGAKQLGPGAPVVQPDPTPQ